MNNRKIALLVVVAGALVVAVVGVVLFEGTDEPTQPNQATGAPPSARRDSARRPGARDARQDASKPRVAPASPEPADPARAERERVRRALRHKFDRAADPSESEAGEAPNSGEYETADGPVLPPPSWTRLPEDYVAEILQEQLIPAAKGCYQDLAPPGTGGDLSLSVAIIGDEEIGGIIDEVDVDTEQSSIEGELSECVRQAMYALQFEPPPEGQGVEEFDFTMRFSDEDEAPPN